MAISRSGESSSKGSSLSGDWMNDFSCHSSKLIRNELWCREPLLKQSSLKSGSEVKRDGKDEEEEEDDIVLILPGLIGDVLGPN